MVEIYLVRWIIGFVWVGLERCLVFFLGGGYNDIVGVFLFFEGRI